ncbi:MAG: tetratricopeptide repeat protein [Planctomycetota bacterium]
MNRKAFVALALFFLPTTLWAAPDVVTSLTPAASAALEVARLELEHEMEEMRAAVRLCRQGEFEEAVPVISKYQAQGDIGATFIFAKMHFDGLGVEQSAETAFEMLSPNIEAGHTPSMIMMAVMKEESAPSEAFQVLRRAASLDDPTALVYLGSVYEQGLLGLGENARLAVRQYEKIQEIGHPAGDFHMARCYDQGIGVSPDALQSSRLYMRAALAGVPEAQVVMARRYYEGKGLEPDPIAAFGWLTRAAQAGSTEAMVLLGQRYEMGDVIQQDLNVAGQLYSTAAKQGDAGGIYHLGMLYLNGAGTEPDPVRAYVLFDKIKNILPQAQTAMQAIEADLNPEQLALARQKIAEAASAGQGN